MQKVLVTGVSSGIGNATVKYLIEKGYKVYGSVRKQEDAVKMNKLFPQHFEALVFDVRNEEAVSAAAKKLTEKLKGDGLTGLVNNAGIAVSGPLQMVKMEDFEKQFDVNVFGLMRVTKAFLPLLGAQENHPIKPGKIINISSISGRFTMPFVTPYSASKFAVESLTDGLRRELLLYGIDVVSLQPGPIQSAIWGKAKDDLKPYPGTIYEPILEQGNRLIADSEKMAIPAIKVAKRIEKILRKNSSTRYVISGQKITHYLTFWVPARVADFIIKIAFKRAVKKFKKG